MSTGRGMGRWIVPGSGKRSDPWERHRKAVREAAETRGPIPREERGFGQYLGIGPEHLTGKDPEVTAERLSKREGYDTRTEDQRLRDTAAILRRQEYQRQREEAERVRAATKAERQRRQAERGTQDRGMGKYLRE